MIFYKTAIYQIAENGTSAGCAVLGNVYTMKAAAVKAGEKLKLTPLSIVEVREYGTAPGRAIVAFGQPSDTGKTVYRNVSGVYKALSDHFKKLREEGADGSMSYMLGTLILAPTEDTFEQAMFKNAVLNLTDGEINDLLAQYGDDEYMVCRGHELFSKSDDIVKPMPVDVSDITGIRLMTRAEVIAFRDNAGAAGAREILKYNGPWLTADEGSHPDTRLCVAGPSEPWLWEGVDSQEDGIGIRPVLTLKHGIIPDEEPGRTCVLFGEASWLCVGSNLYLCEKTLWTDSFGDAGSMQKKLHKWLEDAA